MPRKLQYHWGQKAPVMGHLLPHEPKPSEQGEDASRHVPFLGVRVSCKLKILFPLHPSAFTRTQAPFWSRISSGHLSIASVHRTCDR